MRSHCRERVLAVLLVLAFLSGVGAAETEMERAEGLLSRGVYREAVRILEGVGQEGDVEAASYLCRILQGKETRGQLVVNLSRAAFWCRRAAEGGDLGSFIEIGGLYWSGDGVIKNRLIAKRWFEQAATSGYVEGQLQLCKILGYEAEFYDASESMAWCVRAALGGSDVAQWLIGQRFEGEGRMEMAYGWYLVASESGNPLAKERLTMGMAFGEFDADVRRSGEVVAQRVRLKLEKPEGEAEE